MKKFSILLLALTAAIVAFAAPVLTYNGVQLPWNDNFTRTQCGTLDISKTIIEVSGIACSRVTPGYIWMQSDEIQNKIIATDEHGAQTFLTVNFSKTIRWDWEDLSGGVYNGKNYLFIGAFGDNNDTDGEYNIIFFEEHAIDPANPSITIAPNAIKYQYPDGKNHNTEALMYDNVENMIYIITKVYYDICKVYKLPFRTDYGSTMQTLTYVCDLGLKADLGEGTNPDHGFHLVTAADISPDGKYVLIKNQNNTTSQYSWILYWERQDGESIAQTIQRQPQPLKCYEVEWQGEAICWLDDDTFYTTSDADDGNPPIYKYTRKPAPTPMIQKSFTIDGNLEDWADLTGLYHAEVGSGATYDKLYEMRCYASPTDLYFYLEFDADATQVTPIDVMLNLDDDSSTGHDSWLWGSSGVDCLVEAEDIANMSDAGIFSFSTTAAPGDWSWTDTGAEDGILACSPVTLANSHKAIEGKIVLSKLPVIPTELIKIGAVVYDAPWEHDTGLLPNGSMLEVPIYKQPTGIETVETQPSSLESKKVLIDGRIVIIRGDKMYTPDGKMIKN